MTEHHRITLLNGNIAELVVAKKPHRCVRCGFNIFIGDTHWRVQLGKGLGAKQTWAVCVLCWDKGDGNG